MNFDLSGANNLDFRPPSPPTSMYAAFVAETTLVRTIIEGSGGPDNAEMTEAGLRFVRHLLTIANADKRTSLPNFKDMDAIQEAARSFISYCGSPSTALQTMYSVMQKPH